MKCEICNESYDGRRTRVNGKLACSYCSWANRFIKQGDPQNILKTQFSIDERKLDELHKRIRELETTQYPVSHEAKKFPYSNAISAIPPLDVLESAMLALSEYNFFSDFANVLGDYYGIVAPKYLKNIEKCGENVNARYFWNENTVYTPGTGVFRNHTAFHEMWHALERHGIVPHTKDSEVEAQRYAIFCLRKMGRKKDS
jgi:hypothetical protein